jgi:hypothetical protein
MGAAVALVPSYVRRLPSDQWSSSDASALTTFWNQLEAACGVKSTMEGQMQTLHRRSISDSAMAEYSLNKRAKKRKPKPKTPLGKEAAAFFARAGIDPVMAEDEPTAFDMHPSEQEIHVKESASFAPADDREDLQRTRLIRDGERIRARLVAMSPRHCAVLHAAYGPARGDTERNNGLRKKFGDPLIEIVVGLVWMAHDELSISAAREMAFWRSKDESFVVMQKKQAEKILAVAQGEYGKAKAATWI